MQYIKTDATGRIVACAAPGFHCGDGEIAVTLPEGFQPETLGDWRYESGALIHDPQPAPAAPVPLAQKVHELENALMELAALIGGGAA